MPIRTYMKKELVQQSEVPSWLDKLVELIRNTGAKQ